MRFAPLLVITAAALGSLLLPTARAESLASSAIGAGSSASGSVSDSLKGSSRSSDGGRRAQGLYRVTDVAEVNAQQLRLSLQLEREGSGDDSPATALQLTLPRLALSERAVKAGDLVQATPRPYGTEFAFSDTHIAFFLVLDDAWHSELAARPVTL